MNNLRFAARMLLKSPGFALLVVLTLALGIGSNTAIFSVVNSTFLRTLPYPDPAQLLFLWEQNGDRELSMSYPNFVDLHKQQTVFSSLAVYNVEEERLKTPSAAEQVSVCLVSDEFFQVLGIEPADGRRIRPDDDLPGSAPVGWLTHKAWSKYFGSDPGLLGRNIDLGGESVSVAGILPASFRFVREIDVLRPIAPMAQQRFMTMRYNHNGCFGVGRLKPGVSLAAARAELNTISKRLEHEYPKDNANVGVKAMPWHDRIAGWARKQLLLLQGAVGLVLLMACVNVANMLLARSAAREREMAIRAALGARRSHVVRQLLAESLLLALIGGAAGILLGWWGCSFADRLVPWEIHNLASSARQLDVRVLLFTLGITLLTGVGFGLAPAWRLCGACPNDALKGTCKQWAGHLRLSDVLVAAQVALALVLVISAGLLVRSLGQLSKVNPGFQPEHVLSLRVSTPPITASHPDPVAAVRSQDEILAAVRTVPGVEAAAFGSTVPFTWNASTWTFFPEGKPLPPAGQLPSAYSHMISPDYLSVMQVPLLRGRGFDGHEPQPTIAEGTSVTPDNLAKCLHGLTLYALVSQHMAEQVWPGEDPIGKRFGIGNPDMGLPWVEVIGVVGNTTPEGLDRAKVPEIYVSLRQIPLPMAVYLLIRTQGDPTQITGSVRAAVRAAGCHEPIFSVRSMSARLAETLSDRRFDRDLYGFFAAVALLLAAVGIYGVLAFVVSQRTREVGIRMALGARPAHVLWSVLSRGLWLIGPGTVLGLGGAWGVSRLLRNQLFGIPPGDPVTYAGAALLLTATALLACWLPARRAAKVDPLIALRQD